MVITELLCPAAALLETVKSFQWAVVLYSRIVLYVLQWRAALEQ